MRAPRTPSAAAVGQPASVHEFFVSLAHQGVQVVSWVLLPELAQHELLVARLDAHHLLDVHGISHQELVEAVDARGVLHRTDLRRGVGSGCGSGSGGCGSRCRGVSTGAAAGTTALRGLGLFLEREGDLFAWAREAQARLGDGLGDGLGTASGAGSGAGAGVSAAVSAISSDMALFFFEAHFFIGRSDIRRS